ncbi:hypothetical protein PC128_g15055 [Phytophthora cactorum]|nr:hypothetical protein PC120_g21632 [Phytophthora cactorum]KAG3047499.1 hypothetical protein PC121_g20019 [Phytophthora cactorum]KAG3181602.1 hypothetical protein PC128_g15055 [Phytophthora cactorum]KAG4043369.1 hypothetical protein PC123_g21161 [Phytophthora cactorum]
MSLQLVDREAQETLEAALAFIDEYGHEQFSGGSSLSSHEFDFTLNSPIHPRHTNINCHIAPDTVRSQIKAQLPKRNRSRDRQKLELLQLSVEAELLQNRVAYLTKKQQDADAERGVAAFNVMNPTSGQGNGLFFDVWKDLANKYRRLRREAEMENRHLRGIYTHQVTTLETLKRLLQMQEQVKKTLRFVTRYYAHSCFDADDSALVAMERLHGGLGQLYADTDRALLTNGLGALTCPCSLTNLSPLTDTPSRVEVLFSRIIPFDFKAVGDSFWHEMTKNYVENAVERRQSPREAKATAISQAFTMELEEEGSPVKMQFRYAGKRVVDNHRQVVVLSGQSQLLEAFGVVVSGVHFQEKHWLVLSELSPGVTMVKVCMSMVVHFDCELPNRQQFVDRTCQMLAKQKQMGFESVLQGVEQSLLVGYPS